MSKKQLSRVRHERVYTDGVSEKEIKEIKYENEKEQLKGELETSVEFGQKILLENKKLTQKMFEKEEEKKAMEKELAYVKNLNENLEDRLRDIKSNKMVDIFEREQILEKIKQFKQIKDERDQLADNNAQLRKKYELRTQKYRKLQYSQREMEEKVEFLTDLLEQMKEKHEKTKKLQEQLKELTEKYNKLKTETEEESKMQKYKIKKLKAKNQQIIRNFDLRMEIIKNELSLKTMNMRISKNALKKTFIKEMKKTEEELNYVFGEMLIKFEEFLRKQKAKVKIVKEIEIQRVVEEKIIEKKIIEKKEDINEKMLVIWLKKFIKVKIDKFTASAFKDGKVFLKLIKRFKKNLVTTKVKKGKKLLNFCFNVFSEEFGINKLLDDKISNEDDISKYVYHIFLAFKKEFDQQKKVLKSKIMEISYEVDSAKKKRVKSQKDFKGLIEKKSKLLKGMNQINISLINVTSFYLKNDQLLSFFNEYKLNKKMSELNDVLLQNREKLVSGVGVDDEAQTEDSLLNEYNDLSKDYFKWSKQIQKQFLETKSEVEIKEKNIYPDYEDTVTIIDEKNRQLKNNGKLVNKIWGVFGELSVKCDIEDKSIRNGLIYNKDEIELENDIITYSLKGMMSTKVKNVFRSK